MKKLLLLLPFISVFLVEPAFCSRATLRFCTTENITLRVYAPIDNSANDKDLSDEFTLKPDVKVVYKPEISGFSFIQLAYANGKRYWLIVQDGDSLQLTFDKGNLQFNGSNARGQFYINTFARYANVDSIFEQHLKGGIDTKAIYTDLRKTFWNVLTEDVESLPLVDKRFKQIFYKDMEYAVTGMIARDFHLLLTGRHKTILSNADSLAIRNNLDSIYKALPPSAPGLIKYRYWYSYISEYYYSKLKELSPEKQDSLIKGYTYDTFGPYVTGLLAPAHLQVKIFGSAMLLQIDFAVNEFDKDKMYRHLEQHFPQSQYFSLIKKRYKPLIKKEEAAASTNNEIVFIDQDVKSIKELSQLPALKGKKIFIDVWATWCIPCKAEFAYTSKMDSLAKMYNVSLAYISIDSKELNKKWKMDVGSFDLRGYHILAGENLVADIKQRLYNNAKISIPRYVFLNEKGDIENANAPRPDSWSEVEKLFAGN